MGAFFEGFWEVFFPPKKQKGTYGDAKVATAEDLNRSGNLDGGGFLLGYVDGHPVTSDLEASVVTIARRGYGKSLSMGASIRRETEKHLLIMDASGSICAMHKGALERNGYRVRVIDLTKPRESVHWNPLSYLEGSDEFREARDLETAAELAVKGDGHGTHWVEISRSLFAGFMYEYRKTKTLYEMARILVAEDYDALAKELITLKHSQSPVVQSAFTAFDRVSAKERGSFFSTMVRLFRPHLDPAIKHISENGQFMWEDIFKSPQKEAVFVITGIEAPHIVAPYTRLLIGLAIASAGRYYANNGQPIPRGMNIYVDEADLLGECRPIIEAITKHRKTGINVWLAYQSLAQIDRDAQTLFDNCDVWLTGGLNDERLLQKVSNLIGNHTITTKTKGDSGDSEREEGLRLFSPEAIRSLPKGRFLALVSNQVVEGEMSFTMQGDTVVFR